MSQGFNSMTDPGAYLEHHGIKGQKWGVRRWQNEDGSLTSAGYEHYGYGKRELKKDTRALNRAAYEVNKAKLWYVTASDMSNAKDLRDQAMVNWHNQLSSYEKVANDFKSKYGDEKMADVEKSFWYKENVREANRDLSDLKKVEEIKAKQAERNKIWDEIHVTEEKQMQLVKEMQPAMDKAVARAKNVFTESDFDKLTYDQALDKAWTAAYGKLSADEKKKFAEGKLDDVLDAAVEHEVSKYFVSPDENPEFGKHRTETWRYFDSFANSSQKHALMQIENHDMPAFDAHVKAYLNEMRNWSNTHEQDPLNADDYTLVFSHVLSAEFGDWYFSEPACTEAKHHFDIDRKINDQYYHEKKLKFKDFQEKRAENRRQTAIAALKKLGYPITSDNIEYMTDFIFWD